MKKVTLNIFGSLVFFTPFATVISCGETNPYYLAQEELKNFLEKIQNEEINLSDYENNQEAQAWIKYLNYIFGQNPDENNLYQISYEDDKLEVSIPVTFLGYLETNINDLEGGRIVKILHVDHFHYRYLTYNEYPPTEEEIEQSNNLTYTLTFEYLDDDGNIDWSRVFVSNNFVDLKKEDKSEDKKELINLSAKSEDDYEKEMLNLSTDKSIYKYTIDKSQLNQNSDSVYDLSELENNIYYDSELQYSKQINNNNNSINLAQATLDLGIDIIEKITEDENNGLGLGYENIEIDPEILNWWLNNKPGAHDSESDETNFYYTGGLFGLDDDLLNDLINIKDNATLEIFLNNLTNLYDGEEIKEFKVSIDTYESAIEYEKLGETVEIKLYYYTDPTTEQKYYVDEITVLVQALTGNKNGIDLGFTFEIEKMLKQGQTPTYYVLENNMIFDNQEDQNDFSDADKLTEYMQ